MPSFNKSFLMNHTCLRIKDPKVSVPFYTKNFGLSVIKTVPFPDFTLYMLGYQTAATSKLNWAAREGVLELCHNHGVENDDSFKVNNGNGTEHRGFGHICFSVNDIANVEKNLLKDNVKFQKKLEDGRQKNIAFALDPDGYWIELVERKKSPVNDGTSYLMNHTMIRVKDPKKSIDFYRNVLGFKLLSTHPKPEAKFTLYFLGFEHDPSFVEDQEDFDFSNREGVIELTHNWGTESDDSFAGYHNGNSTENGAIQGYGHTCVSCKDPKKFCDEIDAEFGDKVDWSLKFDKGEVVRDIAFIRDPDGYSIEIFGHDLLAWSQKSRL